MLRQHLFGRGFDSRRLHHSTRPCAANGVLSLPKDKPELDALLATLGACSWQASLIIYSVKPAGERGEWCPELVEGQK